MKGQQGKYGDLGDPGKSVSCDLFTPKTVDLDFKRKLKAEKYEVNNEIIRNATLI